MSKLIECRDCRVEFDPEDPVHSEHGFYNQCRECSEESGLDRDVKKRAFTGFNKDGDWEGIEIVSAEKYKEYKKVEALYGEDVYSTE